MDGRVWRVEVKRGKKMDRVQAELSRLSRLEQRGSEQQALFVVFGHQLHTFLGDPVSSAFSTRNWRNDFCITVDYFVHGRELAAAAFPAT